jgi:hypothetical protein
VESACDVAVNTTEGGLGGTLGARYRSPLIVPQVVAEQPDPVTFHFTSALVLPVTVATTTSDPPIGTFPPSTGEMLTFIPDLDED